MGSIRSSTLTTASMPSSLFKENSAQRFQRESQEIWEKAQTENTQKSFSRQSSLTENLSSSSTEKIKREKVSEKANTTAPDIFPRRAKSKLIKTKPALWEISKEETKNLKNTLLKKEPALRKGKISKE